MSTTRFVSNETLWHELRSRAKSATNVCAAVAFIGSGGADLLPLKKGDSLVVNLGMQTVKQGLTAPREIQKLMRRGVHMFSRSTLHAKFFICDGTAIVGSANISRHSRDVLDEAASMTNDPQAVRRAREFFDKLCTEPVGVEYLKLCLKNYRPPQFAINGAMKGSQGQKRVIEAKLWFIGGLRYIETPKAEAEDIAEIEADAEKKLSDPEATQVEWTRYDKKLSFLDHIRVGDDWVIECVQDNDGACYVHAPSRLLGVKHFSRGHGKQTYVLTYEASLAAESMPLGQFRRRIKRLMPKLDKDSPRTAPIEDVEVADTILGLWTPSGRVSKRRRR